MSVLIKGMDEMPEDGAVLVVRHDDNGKAYIKFACTYGYSMELVELPEKHGDLIDRTTLLKEFELAQKSVYMHGREYANAFYSPCNEISTEWWAVEDMVENADAVIEAEGEG